MLVQRKFITYNEVVSLSLPSGKLCGARETIVCACYGELTAEVDSRLPAECRCYTEEADDAEPESLDSGPQVLLNLPWIVFG